MNVKSYSVSTVRIERDDKKFWVEEGNEMKEGKTNKSSQKMAIKDLLRNRRWNK